MRSPLSASLASAMQYAYSTSLEVHGDIGLSREVLLNRFRVIIDGRVGVAATAETGLAFFEKLHTADLYLATACMLPTEAAWRQFTLLYRTYLRGVSRYVSNTAASAEEIASSVIGHLYMPDGSGRRRIASYTGCGSLRSWLAAVVRNLARKEKLEEHRAFETEESALGVADCRDCPESSLRSREYAALISSAMLEAREKLSDRERSVLILRYRHEVQITQIALAYGVEPSSITRQIERIHKKLQALITEALSSSHHLSHLDIKDCVRDIVENPARYVLTLSES